MKSPIPFLLTLLVALTGCASKQPDMSPIGAGLSVIGLGLVVGCLILAIFRKGGGGHG